MEHYVNIMLDGGSEFPLWRTDVVLANKLTGETFGRIKLKTSLYFVRAVRFEL